MIFPQSVFEITKFQKIIPKEYIQNSLDRSTADPFCMFPLIVDKLTGHDAYNFQIDIAIKALNADNFMVRVMNPKLNSINICLDEQNNQCVIGIIAVRMVWVPRSISGSSGVIKSVLSFNGDSEVSENQNEIDQMKHLEGGMLAFHPRNKQKYSDAFISDISSLNRPIDANEFVWINSDKYVIHANTLSREEIERSFASIYAETSLNASQENPQNHFPVFQILME